MEDLSPQAACPSAHRRVFKAGGFSRGKTAVHPAWSAGQTACAFRPFPEMHFRTAVSSFLGEDASSWFSPRIGVPPRSSIRTSASTHPGDPIFCFRHVLPRAPLRRPFVVSSISRAWEKTGYWYGSIPQSICQAVAETAFHRTGTVPAKRPGCSKTPSKKPASPSASSRGNPISFSSCKADAMLNAARFVWREAAAPARWNAALGNGGQS